MANMKTTDQAKKIAKVEKQIQIDEIRFTEQIEDLKQQLSGAKANISGLAKSIQIAERKMSF